MGIHTKRPTSLSPHLCLLMTEEDKIKVLESNFYKPQSLIRVGKYL